jgi:hypothetical protein
MAREVDRKSCFRLQLSVSLQGAWISELLHAKWILQKVGLKTHQWTSQKEEAGNVPHRKRSKMLKSQPESELRVSASICKLTITEANWQVNYYSLMQEKYCFFSFILIPLQPPLTPRQTTTNVKCWKRMEKPREYFFWTSLIVHLRPQSRQGKIFILVECLKICFRKN